MKQNHNNLKNNGNDKNKKSHYNSSVLNLSKYILIYIFGIVSALAPTWFGNFLKQPELTGRVLCVYSSRDGMTVYNEDTSEKRNTQNNVHTVFLTIGNKKDIPVAIVDYLLMLNFADGSTDICYPFTMDSESKKLEFQFDTYEIVIADLNQNLLTKKKLIVTSDNPVTGFLQFSANKKVSSSTDIQSVTIILYDSYGEEYSIETNVADFRPPSILPRLIEGLKIIPHSDSLFIDMR